jgi:hypothetical protein
VWVAAAASSTINFGQEYGTSGNVLAGVYVGLLSLFAMFLFDEMLAQLEAPEQTLRRENPKFGVRWLTWPSNTFLAAVAWRNYPPVDGTPGTVRHAIENLERVRVLKRAAREGRRGRGSGPAARGFVVAATGPVVRDGDAVVATRDAVGSRPRRGISGAAVASRSRSGRAAERAEVRVPTTTGTVRQWAGLWVAMRADPGVSAALSDDTVALARFGVRARQLRYVRYAATTGALRRRAAELGVALPDEFVDTPTPAVLTDP